MRKRFAVLLAASALGVGAASPVAFAGTGTDAVTEDDGGTDYGWIGLLGLAGLAGLMGRKRDDRVDVRPLPLTPDTLRRLDRNFLLFYTGAARSASKILADQHSRTLEHDESMVANLHRTKEIGYESAALLEAGDLESYAELMHEHWQNKRARSPQIATSHIDDLYTLARRSGVTGGKLVGAGGGGFLLVYAPRPDDTRLAMAAAGAPETRFEFDFHGCVGQEFR